MTREEVEAVVERAVEKGVTSALEKAGIFIENPKESQADLAFLRRFRKFMEGVSNKIGWCIIAGVLVLLGFGGINILK